MEHWVKTVIATLLAAAQRWIYVPWRKNNVKKARTFIGFGYRIIEPDEVFSRFARRSILRNASMFLTECGCSEKCNCFVVYLPGISKYRRSRDLGRKPSKLTVSFSKTCQQGFSRVITKALLSQCRQSLLETQLVDNLVASKAFQPNHDLWFG